MWRVSDMWKPVFYLFEPPYRKPMPQQAFNNHSSILYTHNLSKRNWSPIPQQKQNNKARSVYSNKRPINFRRKYQPMTKAKHVGFTKQTLEVRLYIGKYVGQSLFFTTRNLLNYRLTFLSIIRPIILGSQSTSLTIWNRKLLNLQINITHEETQVH